MERTARPTATPKRRLPVLFADIAGSTRLYEEHGDEAARAAVAACVEVMSGFTSIIDLEWAKGKLLVAELDEDSWAAVEFLGGGAGGTINACNVHSGHCREVATGIPILTAITAGKNGLYATRNALIPGLAEVFKVR